MKKSRERRKVMARCKSDHTGFNVSSGNAPPPQPIYFPNILFLFTSPIRLFNIQNSTSPYISPPLLVLAHSLLVLSCPTSLLVEPWPSSMSLHLPWLFPHALIFYPEDGSNILLRNSSKFLPNYMAPGPGRRYCYLHGLQHDHFKSCKG